MGEMGDGGCGDSCTPPIASPLHTSASLNSVPLRERERERERERKERYTILGNTIYHRKGVCVCDANESEPKDLEYDHTLIIDN